MKLVGPQELEALIAAADVDVVDVREPNEWVTGHIPGARLVPLGTLGKAQLPRDNVVFVCAKGGRSAKAAQLAEQLGLREVYSLDGGTQAWVAARLPVTVPSASKSPAPEAPPAPVAPEADLTAVVGANLRAHRTRLGLSLDDLAQRAGVSRTLLGQIELGRTQPSISVTWRITQALGVPFSTLLTSAQPGGLRVLHRAQARLLQSADGRFSSRALFPFDEQQQAEFYELRLAPHAREDADPHRPGTRENLVVTSGQLQLVIGAEKVALGLGDAVQFAADVPHSYVNTAGEPCVMYLVMTYARA